MKKWIFALGTFFSSLTMPTARAEVEVTALAGSTRVGSYNRLLVEEAASIARQRGAKVNVVDLADYPLPIYSEDFERVHGMPANAKKLRRLILRSQAVMIATPEYNGAVPGLLKNVIDWLSRSEDGTSSREAFKGRFFAIMSASPGKGGGKNGAANLKQIIEWIGGSVIPSSVAIADAGDAFDAKGLLIRPGDKEALENEISTLFETCCKEKFRD